jgi:hypothetical protein
VRRIVRYDRRGHSRSEWRGAPPTVHDHVADWPRSSWRLPTLVRSLALHEPPLWSVADVTAGVVPVLEQIAALDR